MASRRPRGGLLFPLILIAGGILFLLHNFGVVDVDSWRAIVRLWPILVIAVGLELIVGRSSLRRALSALLALGVLLGVGFVAFNLFAPETWLATEEVVRVELDDAAKARVSLSCEGCRLHIDDAAADLLLAGAISIPRLASLKQATAYERDSISYTLTSGGSRWGVFSNHRDDEAPWDLSLTDAIPIELVAQTTGSVDVDLRTIRAVAVDVTSGGGASRIVLSEVSSSPYVLSGSAFTLVVPPAVGVRIHGAATTALEIPTGYVQSAGVVVSPDYEHADVRADVTLRPGIESLKVEPAEPDGK